MKNILLMAVTLFMLAASITSQAGEGTTNGTDTGTTPGFVGLWEGVDPEDGSHIMISISSNNGGTLKVLLYATFFTVCDDSDRGFVQGTGNVSTEGALTVNEFIVTCFEPSKTVTLPATFTRNPDGTLKWDRSAEPAPAPPTVILHKTSN